MATKDRTLHVVTHARWVADDFSADPPRGWAVQHHHGLSLPQVRPGDAFWAPMEWMARARRSGLDVPLAMPSMTLLDNPEMPRSRGVFTMTLDRAAGFTVEFPVFAKLAAMKHADVPARVYDSTIEFTALLASLGAPPDTLVQLQWGDPGWVAEFRLFVANGGVTGGSPYLLVDETGEQAIWTEGMTGVVEGRDRIPEAIEFGQTIAARIDPLLVAGFVLDVGLQRDGGWSIVETNPAWSSATYGTPIRAAWESVLAANDPHPASPKNWVPDPWLAQCAARQSPLPWECRPKPRSRSRTFRLTDADCARTADR